MTNNRDTWSTIIKDQNKFRQRSSKIDSKEINQSVGLTSKRGWFWTLSVSVVLVGGLIAFLVHHDREHDASKKSDAAQEQAWETPYSLSLADLTRLTNTELEHTDIALLNLSCAQHLPGAGEINISNQLATLDQWAKHVQTETERHLYRFRANPQEYYGSEGYFRMLMMAVVFYEDFNIRYNPERMSIPETINPDDRFFADSRDVFLHGLLGDRRMGTCSSMPVLYAAVGRRLAGYSRIPLCVLLCLG